MISTQALRFNLDRGVSVLPGAEKLSEIEEDQATPLGPPVARVQVPAAASMLSMANINKLWKAMIAPNSDMVERDGHWYGKPSEVVRPVRKEVLSQNKAIIEQIHPIIKNLPRKESAATRRKVICEEIAKLADNEDRKLGSMVVIPADVFASRDAKTSAGITTIDPSLRSSLSASLAISSQMTLRRVAALSFRGRFLMMGWICSIIALFCDNTSFRTGRTTSEGLPYQWPSRSTISEFGAIMAFHSLLMLAIDSMEAAAGTCTRATGGPSGVAWSSSISLSFSAPGSTDTPRSRLNRRACVEIKFQASHAIDAMSPSISTQP